MGRVTSKAAQHWVPLWVPKGRKQIPLLSGWTLQLDYLLLLLSLAQIPSLFLPSPSPCLINLKS